MVGKGVRKPAELRQGRGTHDIGLVHPIDSPAVIPAPPSGLLKQTKETWEAFWRSPVSQVVDMGSDRAALEHWIWCIDERTRAQRLYRRARYVEGSKGQIRVNPMAKVIAELSAQIRAAEDAFGLTPQSRLKLGIAIGDATRSLADLLNDLADADDEPELVDLDELIEAEGRISS